MNGQSGLSLIELLYSPDPDVNRIINSFVTQFNLRMVSREQTGGISPKRTGSGMSSSGIVS
jgi:hypothetical protein